MKLRLFSAVVLLYFPIVFTMNAQGNPEIHGNHRRLWDLFLKENFSIDDPVSKVNKIMGAFSSDTMTVRLGGSGDFHRFYLIDDFIQIRASFNREGSLQAVPLIMERGKWLKFPDGQGYDTQDEVIITEEFKKLMKSEAERLGIDKPDPKNGVKK